LFISDGALPLPHAEILQLSEPAKAYAAESQSAHLPALVALAPVSRVVPSSWLPQVVCAAQLSVSDVAKFPESQAAHEPALFALAPVSRAVLSVCFPQVVCAAQLLSPDAA
jgi:hypothetical protein